VVNRGGGDVSRPTAHREVHEGTKTTKKNTYY